MKREKKMQSVEVEATDREWREFRVRVLKSGKTVRGVFREVVLKYGKRVKVDRELEGLRKIVE